MVPGNLLFVIDRVSLCVAETPPARFVGSTEILTGS